MGKNITIAIDGWSSCGKSTLAKALARELHYVYVDSGAMYRGVTLYMLRKGLVSTSHVDIEQIIQELTNITVSFSQNENGKADLLLNGENVEAEIRAMEVSNVVSSIAKIREVRQFLVAQQRLMGKLGGVVMDGRDIGSVVFPHAELKLFITADPEVRAQRRYKELFDKGERITIEEVRENLQQRDEMDATREESPLIQTEDAIVIDNSNLTQEEQLELALQLVRNLTK
ncbi:MAG: (d)CMP kinase [Brumimicrobium sp.]|nr:(d)CMP kinase [Brumimicrobium sp.]MCO5269333.1 (d)CMP kinase [Brumimicrobium sp.]